MAPGAARRDAPARGAHQEALLDQERLDHVLQRAALLADRCGDAVDADRPAIELLDYGEQQAAIERIEAVRIDLEQVEGRIGHPLVDAADIAQLPRFSSAVSGDR